MSEAILKAKQQMHDEQRKKNRELMPNLAALMDEVREQFPGAKLVWGEDLETGHSVGVKDDDPEKTFKIPENYFPSRIVSTKKKEKTP